MAKSFLSDRTATDWEHRPATNSLDTLCRFRHSRFMKTFRCKPASIPYSRWGAYVTAGAASTLACASSAEAEIHYSGIVNHNFANGSFAGPLDPGLTLELGVGTGTQIGHKTSAFGVIHIREA